MAITVDQLKGVLYIDIDKDDFNADIQIAINEISEQAIEYMDNVNITTVADFNVSIERALRIQINYEFRRRADPGLSSVQYEDGSINKFSVDEWLGKVRRVLNRSRPTITHI